MISVCYVEVQKENKKSIPFNDYLISTNGKLQRKIHMNIFWKIYDI
jgi:hypothetical protein